MLADKEFPAWYAWHRAELVVIVAWQHFNVHISLITVLASNINSVSWEVWWRWELTEVPGASCSMAHVTSGSPFLGLSAVKAMKVLQVQDWNHMVGFKSKPRQSKPRQSLCPTLYGSLLSCRDIFTGLKNKLMISVVNVLFFFTS